MVLNPFTNISSLQLTVIDKSCSSCQSQRVEEEEMTDHHYEEVWHSDGSWKMEEGVDSSENEKGLWK